MNAAHCHATATDLEITASKPDQMHGYFLSYLAQEFAKQYVQDAFLEIGFDPTLDRAAPQLLGEQVVEPLYKPRRRPAVLAREARCEAEVAACWRDPRLHEGEC